MPHTPKDFIATYLEALEEILFFFFFVNAITSHLTTLYFCRLIILQHAFFFLFLKSQTNSDLERNILDIGEVKKIKNLNYLAPLSYQIHYGE